MLLDDAMTQTLLRYGDVILRQDFREVDGISTVRVVLYEGQLWYVLMKNGMYAGVHFLGNKK